MCCLLSDCFFLFYNKIVFVYLPFFVPHLFVFYRFIIIFYQFNLHFLLFLIAIVYITWFIFLSERLFLFKILFFKLLISLMLLFIKLRTVNRFFTLFFLQ